MARTALVTGGSRGIGAAISVALRDAGYKVAATYAGNDEAAATFTQQTGIKTFKWNVADYDACAAGIEKVEADLGPIDVLVNNAGITRDAPFHKMTKEQWSQVIDTNLTGVFNMTHPVWPGMRERKFGRIITIRSINGQKGQFAQVNYAASKAGDLGITKSLAQEGARYGITANAICPGYIETEINADWFATEGGKKQISKFPRRRLMDEDALDAALMMLAGDAGRQITGSAFQIDDGQIL